ncbi:hypothetical protein [Catellatospora chokoriensis]|uniref:ABC-2 type transport system permease protein n=1 Tax=Catellatospora chokoriensis TaxID=310353 RepID=A0A8J3NR37_9ACTN|nr:hypothetical protein [Catellatospora chokoriensis]GIF87710.1 hypothetical protein Cch02nite_11540 [Catellatospora chokoriensis]
MVGVLTLMKLRVLAHSTSGARAGGLFLGAAAGLALAAGTIMLAGADLPGPALRGDLFTAALAVWMFGWLLGPVYTGGGDESIRPEQLALIPLPPRRVAFGFLAVSFIGVGPLISLVAFSALVVYAAGLGLAAFIVALVLVPLQLVLVVALSRLMLAVMGLAVRSRPSAVLSALINAGVNATLNQSWVLIWAAVQFGLVDRGLPAGFATLLRVLPSGWAVVCLDALARGDWPLAAATGAGLVALPVAATLIWSRLLVRRTTTRPAHRGPGRGRTPLLDRLDRAGPVGVVAAKELRTWSRDLMRLHLRWFAIWFGLVYTLWPLAIGWAGLLPWAGVIVVVMAAATSANLYGLDGTALWLTLVDPGRIRADVRGRQVAWLIQVAPVAVALTVAGTALGGGAWTWPWALALLAALLGGGAGLIAYASVVFLVPGPEPARRGGNPLDAGNIFGQVLAMLVVVPATALPAAGVALLGNRTGSPLLSWAAVAVGLATGAACTWWLGREAYRRLGERGPELLARMSGGGTVTPGPGRATAARVKLPPRRAAVVTFLVVVCWIPLFPQGLVPLYLIWRGSDTRLWFLALHLDDPFRVPVAVAMALLGVGMLWLGTVLSRRWQGAAA